MGCGGGRATLADQGAAFFQPDGQDPGRSDQADARELRSLPGGFSQHPSDGELAAEGETRGMRAHAESLPRTLLSWDRWQSLVSGKNSKREVSETLL